MVWISISPQARDWCTIPAGIQSPCPGRHDEIAAFRHHRGDPDGLLRKLAKAETDGRVARRILAIANALDGMSRKAAAEAVGMDRQTLRDWVLRYNELGGLTDRRRSTLRSRPS